MKSETSTDIESAATSIPVPPPIFSVAEPEVAPPVKPLPATTAVMSPVLLVKPESLLKILSGISFAAFLLSAPLSRTINSSVPTIVAVMSVSSDRSTFKVTLPELPPPLKPVPAVTPVISPVFEVEPVEPVATAVTLPKASTVIVSIFVPSDVEP